MTNYIMDTQDIACTIHGCTLHFINQEAFQKHVIEEHPNRGGSSCFYCEHKEKIEKKTKEYLKGTRDEQGRIKIPFVQELALDLDVHRDTIYAWCDKKNDKGEPEHPWFSDTVKKLLSIQELGLLKRTLGNTQPTGAIFQLKANHGYIETEKKMLAGDPNNPIAVSSDLAKYFKEEEK